MSFEGIVASAAAQNVTFTFRPVNGSGDITQTISVPSSGAFRFPDLPTKQYTLHIKGDKYLAANVSVNTTNGDVSGVNATLPGGDANGDNTVNFDDFLVLLNAYGSNANDTTSGYDSAADFNDDGTVTFDDFLILLDNFGAVGDN